MALSVLKGEAEQAGVAVAVEYGNLHLAKRLGLKQYSSLMTDLEAFPLLGEMIFGQAAGFVDGDAYFACVREEIQARYPAAAKMHAVCMQAYGRFLAVYPKMDAFLTEMVEIVLAHQPQIVGCDITYQQKNAALALLQRIKKQKPSIMTVLGGNGCAGEAGQALADSTPFVDYVFSGEADDIFAAFCCQAASGKGKEEIHAAFPSALIAGGQDFVHSRPSLEDAATPDFSDYFRNLEELNLAQKVDPWLLVETSRGCWWGERNRCSFCEADTQSLTHGYRQKTCGKLIDELAFQSKRYGIDSFLFTDCIMSTEHIRELLAALAQSGLKLELFAEVKADLVQDNIKDLHAAGFTYLQPGMAFFHDECDLSDLLHCGKRAIKQVELLKHCQYHGVAVSWDLLKDLLGEQPGWYQEMAELLPRISHLQPPASLNSAFCRPDSLCVQAAALRGSAVYPAASSGRAAVRESKFPYPLGYGAPSVKRLELEVSRNIWDILSERIEEWTTSYDGGRGDRLVMGVFAQCVEINDLRKCAIRNFYTLTGVLQDIYLLADTAVDCDKVKEVLREKYSPAEIDAGIYWLLQAKLLLQIGGEILALAVRFPFVPYRRGRRHPLGKTHLEGENNGER